MQGYGEFSEVEIVNQDLFPKGMITIIWYINHEATHKLNSILKYNCCVHIHSHLLFFKGYGVLLLSPSNRWGDWDSAGFMTSMKARTVPLLTTLPWHLSSTVNAYNILVEWLPPTTMSSIKMVSSFVVKFPTNIYTNQSIYIFTRIGIPGTSVRVSQTTQALLEAHSILKTVQRSSPNLILFFMQFCIAKHRDL